MTDRTLGDRVRYLWYLIAGASSIPALRLGREWWESDYEQGGLARTEGDVELPRHLLVAGLIRRYAPGGSILDVGCGSGGLIAPLRDGFGGVPTRYVGLDLSTRALDIAAERARTEITEGDAFSVELVQGSFDEYEPRESFDAIVFSESLYYAPDPRRTVERHLGALHAGGIVVVTMWRRPSRRRVWRALRETLPERTRCRVTVPRRPAWDIAVFTRP
jgi:SAM-dependent methyltransferase